MMRTEQELVEAWSNAIHLQEIALLLKRQLTEEDRIDLDELEHTKQVLGWALGYESYELPEAMKSIEAAKRGMR